MLLEYSDYHGVLLGEGVTGTPTYSRLYSLYNAMVEIGTVPHHFLADTVTYCPSGFAMSGSATKEVHVEGQLDHYTTLKVKNPKDNSDQNDLILYIRGPSSVRYVRYIFCCNPEGQVCAPVVSGLLVSPAIKVFPINGDVTSQK